MNEERYRKAWEETKQDAIAQIQLKQEQKAEDDRIKCLCDALNKIMDIEMGIALEYRVNVEDSEIYNTAHDAIQKVNPEYFSTNNK